MRTPIRLRLTIVGHYVQSPPERTEFTVFGISGVAVEKSEDRTGRDAVETQIAEMAAGAFADAQARALRANQPVVVTSGDELVKLTATGGREVVGKVKPLTKRIAIKIQKDVEIPIQWAIPQD